jgi:hypothetical protein
VSGDGLPSTEMVPPDRRNELMSIWLYLGPLVVLVCLMALYSAYVLAGPLLLDMFYNPNRHFYEFPVMLPVAIIVTSVVAFISHALSYPLLICCAVLLLRRLGRVPFALLLATTPVLGLLTWYGYDRFVPDFRWYTDDSPPYEHGLTLERFLKSWALEVAVVLGYWWPIRSYRLSARVPQ